MKNFQNKVAVITGAGSGMGRELALLLAERGATVVLNDWNEATLQETIDMVKKAGGKAGGRAFSVADREAVYAFAEETAQRFGQVDIVVNNAGISLLPQKAESLTYEQFEKIIDVNMWGVVYGCKAFLPHLKARPEASLVNISSIFGIVAYPDQAPYVMSKFAVRGFTEILRQELRPTNIAVTCIHPGGIATNIARNAPTENKAALEKFSQAFDKMAITSARDAAIQILSGIESKKKRVVIGKDAKFMDFIARLWPSSYEKTLMKNYNIERFK